MSKKAFIVILLLAACLAGCKKASSAKGDAVSQKLQDLAGKNAADCGRVTSQNAEQIRTAGECAMQAADGKRAFYVGYDLPGLTVAIAGAADGKLYLVQAESGEGKTVTPADVRATPCPASLRLAQSGRVTCNPPGGGMGAVGGNPHGGMAMPPAGGENPHGGMAMPPAGGTNPHGGMGMPSEGTPNPHGTTGGKAPVKQSSR